MVIAATVALLASLAGPAGASLPTNAELAALVFTPGAAEDALQLAAPTTRPPATSPSWAHFQLFQSPPFPGDRFGLFTPIPLPDPYALERLAEPARSHPGPKTRVWAFDFHLWPQRQGDQWFEWQNVVDPSVYLFDGLGSVTALVRQDGLVQSRKQWDAWGVLRNESGESSNRFGFTGHEHDPATGLIYAKARYIDPELGRFLSEDPVFGEAMTPPSLHRYLYAYANPAVYVDPSGRISELQSGADLMEQTPEGLQALIENLDRSDEQGGSFAGRQVAQALVPFAAAGAAGAEITEDILRTANTVVNLRLVQLALQGEIDPRDELTNRWSREAALELSDQVKDVVGLATAGRDAIEFAREHPFRAGVEVIKAGQGALRAAKAFFKRRDAVAEMRMGSVLFQVAAGLAGEATFARSLAPLREVAEESFSTLLRGFRTAGRMDLEAPSVGRFTDIRRADGSSFFDIPGPGPRGEAIEDALGKNTPGPFRTIDRLDPGGTVVSIKSIDITTPAKVERPRSLRDAVRTQIRQAQRFEGATLGRFSIEQEDIRERVLEVVIQRGRTTAQQRQVLEQLEIYAQERNVSLAIIEIP